MKTKLMKHTVSAAAVVAVFALGATYGNRFAENTPASPATALAAPADNLKAGTIDPKNGKKIKYWAAPMDPTYIRNEPGKSPMGMDLVPVYEEDGAEKEPTSTIRIDPVTIQNMGIRTVRVERRPLAKTIRAFGTVTYDERHLYNINTKFSGWIEKLHVSSEGQRVRQGQPLFDIYSPELVSAQEEYLAALDQLNALAQTPYPRVLKNAESLLKASRQRMAYWDISPDQINRLEQSGHPSKTITVFSPAAGVVLKKNAYDGHFVKAGQNQFEIADLSTVWVDVDIYEYELPWIREGMPARMNLAYIPGHSFSGKVLFVYPYLESKSRTARLRLAFTNHENLLKPQMYANIELEAALAGEHPVIPQEAVIDSGVRKVVFVDRGEGRFDPREVEIGLEVDQDSFQVLAGLEPGEKIVTSAQFMLDSESRLREAIQKMLAAGTGGAAEAETDAGTLDMDTLDMTSELDDMDMGDMNMESRSLPTSKNSHSLKKL